jgi:trigger factor
VKATVEPLEGNKVKVSVEVDEAEFDKAIDAAFRKIAREVRVPGFRPGKAPRKVLEGRLGSGVGREQALHDSVPEFYAQALAEHDVDAIAQPEIDITNGQDEGPLAFDAVVEVRPEITVPGYNGLRVTLDRPEADESDVDAQIDRMRQVQASLAEVDRPAIDGDVVTIDIAGSLDGEPQEGLTADDYSYEVGTAAITPEVDPELRGAKAGDILQFEATHPDESEERKLEFRILVKQVNERVLPEADDTWASENSEYDTIDELRASIRDRMQRIRKAQARLQLRERTSEALADLVSEEPPDSLVQHDVQHQLQDLALRARAQGLELEQWLAATGRSPEEVTDELRQAATRSVKVDLALRAVAEAEQITCTDEELDEEIERVAAQVGQKPARVRAQFERGGQLPAVRSDIRKRKAFEWLVEQVEIVDQDGQPLDRATFDSDDTDETEDAVPPPAGRADEAEIDSTDEDETDKDANEGEADAE